eukprot:m.311958 g.311958  ORF g.311958 m.311958 type:complete len:160 (+) comp183742_c0_seq1:28-507(+)
MDDAASSERVDDQGRESLDDSQGLSPVGKGLAGRIAKVFGDESISNWQYTEENLSAVHVLFDAFSKRTMPTNQDEADLPCTKFAISLLEQKMGPLASDENNRHVIEAAVQNACPVEVLDLLLEVCREDEHTYAPGLDMAKGFYSLVCSPAALQRLQSAC